jgi:DNA-binding NtrC family response regulator
MRVEGGNVSPKSLLEDKRILIVDDEPDVLDVLEELLSMCHLKRASSFEEAKDLLETQYFDIAILDIMGVEGYELLKIANDKDVVGVMLTAHAMTPEHVEKSYQEGAGSFVPKEEIGRIELFLNDILEAKAKGKSLWWRWFDRFADYFERKFGPEWQKKHGITVK